MRRKRYLILISVLVIGLMPLSLISGETTPPIVNITSHTTNEEVSGSITITATASDAGSGIDFLQFYFGGDLISTDSSSPYSSTSITVKNYKEGAQTIAVVAFDNDENYAVDTVIVNVVIYNYEYDWGDYVEDQSYDYVWIWFRKYDMYIEESYTYGIGDWVRKVEFDWYSNDAYKSNVDCNWVIFDDWHILNPFVRPLNTPGTDPTHVTLIFGPGEVSYEPFQCLRVGISMKRNGDWILSVYNPHWPIT